MIEPRVTAAPDGVRLAMREVGAGRPVLLLHGFVSDADTNWIRYGHAEAIAAAGFRVIMPDLRAHGSSDKPHNPAAYRGDVLVVDGLALIRHLGLTDYDLGGYSLGARTAAAMVARGATPGRLVLAGMGLTGLTDATARREHFHRIFRNLGTFPKFSPEWNVEAFLKTTGGDPVALDLLIDSWTSLDEAAIRGLKMPTLVVAGAEDDDNGSHEALAGLMPDATVAEVPGGHMSAVTKPELGRAIADFLREGRDL